MTLIDPTVLVDLRAQGQAMDRDAGPFVDPNVVSQVKRILHRRGEPWAVEVLGRPLDRRSTMFPHLPWLHRADLYTLVLADTEEDRAAFDRVTAAFDHDDDTEERINCPKVGTEGHRLCGVCDTCHRPRFECGHAAT